MSNKSLERFRNAFTKVHQRLGNVIDITPGHSLGLSIDTGKPVKMTAKQMAQHILIGGATGTGKSTLMENLGDKLHKEQLPFWLIDPHHGLFKKLAKLIPDAVLIDLSDESVYVNLNPFQWYDDKDKCTSVIVNLIKSSWLVEDFTEMAVVNAVLPAVIRTAIEMNGNFETAYNLCMELSRQSNIRKYIQTLNLPRPIAKLWDLLDTLPSVTVYQILGSSARRIYEFLRNPRIALMVCQKTETIDFVKLLRDKETVLFSIDGFTAIDQRLLSSIISGGLTAAVYERKSPEPVVLTCDELGILLTPELVHLTSRTRAYGLFIYGAVQTLSQLKRENMDDRLMQELLTNCTVKAIFGGMSWEESLYLAGEIGFIELDNMKIKHELYRRVFAPYVEWVDIHSYSTSSSESSSEGKSWGSSSGSSSGSSKQLSEGTTKSYDDPDIFHSFLPGYPDVITYSNGLSNGSNSGSSSSESRGGSEGSSRSSGESHSVSRIPITLHDETLELASVTFESLPDQLMMTAKRLKAQDVGECALFINNRLYWIKVDEVESDD